MTDESPKRHDNTYSLLSKKVNPMIELFYEFAQLKNLYHAGWLKKGRDVSEIDCESVADHSFNVAILSYIIAEEYRPDLDSSKVMKLGLFHDIGEVYVGDVITTEKGSNHHELELASAKKVFAKFPNPDKYLNIWIEYEDQKTPEAKFVKQVDNLEMALQASLYEKLGYDGLDAFFPYVDKIVKDPKLRPIFDELLTIR